MSQLLQQYIIGVNRVIQSPFSPRPELSKIPTRTQFLPAEVAAVDLGRAYLAPTMIQW